MSAKPVLEIDILTSFHGLVTLNCQNCASATLPMNWGCCNMLVRPLLHDFANVNIEGKAELVNSTQDLAGAIDSSGICMFTNVMFPAEHLAQMLDAACEVDWDAESMQNTGERIWNLERQYNLAEGFTRADDCLPGLSNRQYFRGQYTFFTDTDYLSSVASLSHMMSLIGNNYMSFIFQVRLLQR